MNNAYWDKLSMRDKHIWSQQLRVTSDANLLLTFIIVTFRSAQHFFFFSNRLSNRLSRDPIKNVFDVLKFSTRWPYLIGAPIKRLLMDYRILQTVNLYELASWRRLTACTCCFFLSRSKSIFPLGLAIKVKNAFNMRNSCEVLIKSLIRVIANVDGESAIICEL